MFPENELRCVGSVPFNVVQHPWLASAPGPLIRRNGLVFWISEKSKKCTKRPCEMWAKGVLPLEFKPAHSVGDLLVQHLEELEREAEDKGGWVRWSPPISPVSTGSVCPGQRWRRGQLDKYRWSSYP